MLHGIGEGPAAWGHDVNRLGANVSASLGEALGAEVAGAVQRLARHDIPSRYPDAVPGDSPSAYYSASDAEAARLDAETVIEAVDSSWRALTESSGRSGGGG